MFTKQGVRNLDSIKTPKKEKAFIPDESQFDCKNGQHDIVKSFRGETCKKCGRTWR